MSSNLTILGVSFQQLRQIAHPKGDIFHALKSSEKDFLSFGEAYFSKINPGQTKGWKKHNQMRLNLIVPMGSVKFYVYDEKLKVTESIVVGECNYGRLTVEPGLWVAFEGLGDSTSIVLNIASIEHDPTESESRDLNEISFNEV